MAPSVFIICESSKPTGLSGGRQAGWCQIHNHFFISWATQMSWVGGQHGERGNDGRERDRKRREREVGGGGVKERTLVGAVEERKELK